MVAQNPATWSTYLQLPALNPWVEYPHNSEISASTCLSPFMASIGYHSPLFEVQEDKVAVTVQTNMRKKVWRQVRDALLLLTAHSNRQIGTGLPLMSIGQVRKFGFPPGTSRSRSSLGS